MTPEERAHKFLTDNLPTMEGYGELVAAIRAAVAEEREACAKVAESIVATFGVTQSTLGVQGHIAAAIRSRP